MSHLKSSVAERPTAQFDTGNATVRRLLTLLVGVIWGLYTGQALAATDWNATRVSATALYEDAKAALVAIVRRQPGPALPTQGRREQGRMGFRLPGLVLLDGMPTAVGRTKGEFDVSGAGAATYAVPLWLPPGINGLAPKLTLSYSSSSSNGLLGLGWGLSGLGAISRCEKTWAQNGVVAPVQLTSSDRYCFEGVQLRLTAGTYGAVGSEYATELEGFAKFILMGSWWKVQTKDGLIYEYGATVGSNIPVNGTSTTREWALNKVSDRAGNYWTVEYYNDTANGSYRPNTITYTYGASGVTAYNRVLFTYQSRNDTLVEYANGGRVQENYLVSSIDVQESVSGTWTKRKSYNFQYNSSPYTNRSLLWKIQECSATACFLPTVMTYSTVGGSGYGFTQTNSTAISLMAYSMTVDVNGDGRDDVVFPTGSDWQALIANTTSFYSSPSTSGVSATNYQKAMPIDFNSDGKMDILVPNASNNWRILQSTSSGTTLSFTTIDTSSPATGAGGNAWVADANGDGRPDICYTSGSSIQCIYNNGSSGFGFANTLYWLGGGEAFATSAAPSLNETFSSEIRSANFNNDGVTDLMVFITVGGTPQWRVLVSNGSGYATAATLPATVGTIGGLADLNGDRLTDLVYDCSGSWCIRFGSGTGLSAQVNTFLSSGSGNDVLLVDWDNDGDTDVLRGSVGGNYTVFEARNGTLQNYCCSSSLPVVPASSSPRIQDVNGDGFGDLVWNDASNFVNLRNHANGFWDLATEFRDAFGMYAQPSYDTTVGSGIWNPSFAFTSFPHRQYNGPRWVVRTVTANDGSGGTFTQNYSYFGGLENLQGRGYLGFEYRRATDSRTNMVVVDYFKQEFPYTGMVYQREELQPGGTTLTRKLVSTPAVQTLGAGQETRQFPYWSQKVEYLYEYGGSKNGQLITQTTTNLTYDAYGNATTVSTSTVDKDSTSPWFNETHSTQTVNTITNDTTNWCLGRPTQTTVTNTSPGYTAQTRTTTGTIDYVLCRPTQEVVEPSSSTLMVTRTFGYDTFGNVNSVAVVGKNSDATTMATRTTTTSYGTRGVFPEAVTNAASETESATFDYFLGVPLTKTDRNGLVTSYQYDGFARQTLETRPDGTKTSRAFAACDAANSYCGTSDLRWEEIVTDLTTANATIRYGYVFYDGMDRKRFSQRVNLAGGLTTSITTYDALGRKAREYVPVSTGASHYHQFAYDLLGRPTSDTLYLAGGTFDRQTTVVYAGRAVTITDAKGYAKVQYADVRGNLKRVVDPSPGGTTTYDYDPWSNLVSTTDATSVFSSAVFNIRGFKTSINDPDRGAWTFAYDSLGELTSHTDAKSQTATYTYDLVGRRTGRSEPEGTSTWTIGTSAVNKNVGKIISLSGPGYSEAYTYDSLGRPAQRTITGDATYTIDYAYDAATGQLDNVQYPVSTGGYRLRPQYLYQNGILQTIRDFNAPSTVWWQLNSETARGAASDETLGNGVHILSGYDDATGHLNTRTSGTVGSSYNNHQNLSFAWDKNENLTDRGDVLQSLTEHFNYDQLDRITSSTLNGVTNLSLTFDAAGNVLTKSDVGTYTYDTTRKHAVASTSNGWSFTYDNNGNMLTGRGATVTWKSYNMPASIGAGVNTSAFDYTPDRQYWKQTAQYSNGPETTVYVGGLLEKVSGASVTEYRHMIAAGSAMIIVTRSTGSNNDTYYATQDHLGSSSVLTNSAGTIVLSESFEAYGKRRGSNWQGSPSAADFTAMSQTTRRGFTGHTMLDNLGLIHMNGRVYDPMLGRFMSPDPVIQSLVETQSLNPYTYAWNNPLKYIDPSGYFLNWIKKAFQRIGHAISRLWHNSLFRAVVGIAVAAATGYVWHPLVGGAGSLANVSLGGALSGAITGGDGRSVLSGALTAALFYGAGSWGEGRGIGATTTAHAMVGCVSAVAGGGGNCARGAASAGFAHYAGLRTPSFETPVGNTIKAGVLGGFGSRVSGGSFSDGFTVGALGYLSNQIANHAAERQYARRCASAPCGYADGLDVVIELDENTAEVRTGGTRAWRNNNPGNIEDGPFARGAGSIGVAARFAIFPSAATGGAALDRLLLTPRYQARTVEAAIAAYAPPVENNTAAYVGHVTQSLGVPATTTLSALSPQQLSTLAGAIQSMEGWTVGNVRTVPLTGGGP